VGTLFMSKYFRNRVCFLASIFFPYRHCSCRRNSLLLLSQFTTCYFLVSLFQSALLFTSNIFQAKAICGQHFSWEFLFLLSFYRPTLLFSAKVLGWICFLFLSESFSQPRTVTTGILAVRRLFCPSNSCCALRSIFSFLH